MSGKISICVRHSVSSSPQAAGFGTLHARSDGSYQFSLCKLLLLIIENVKFSFLDMHNDYAFLVVKEALHGTSENLGRKRSTPS